MVFIALELLPFLGLSAWYSLMSASMNAFTFAVFVGVVWVVISAVRRYAPRAPVVTKPGAFDAAKLKIYRDCLDAVSLRVGMTPPPLVVTNMLSPLAYVDVQQQRRVLAVTNTLLAADFTYYEIECIVAVLLAKWVLDKGDETPPGYFDHWAKELEVNELLVGFVRAEFLDDQICLFSMLTDTYAARLTGQPIALKKAINKSDKLLERNPVRPRAVEPPLIFIEPSAGGHRGFMNVPRWLFKIRFRSMGPKGVGVTKSRWADRMAGRRETQTASPRLRYTQFPRWWTKRWTVPDP
jgi:hypothetical protein